MLGELSTCDGGTGATSTSILGTLSLRLGGGAGEGERLRGRSEEVGGAAEDGAALAYAEDLRGGAAVSAWFSKLTRIGSAVLPEKNSTADMAG